MATAVAHPYVALPTPDVRNAQIEEQAKAAPSAPSVPQLIEVKRKNAAGQEEVVQSFLKGRLLGKGGFARCYKVQCVETGQSFACKVVPKATLSRNRARQKLQTEIKIHRSLSHPRVVRFHQYFEDADNVYILLELCTNSTLSELVRRQTRCSEEETRRYMLQILEATEYLHKSAIIHRDLKLGNVFLDKAWDVKLGDFGLAAKLERRDERKQTICGTPNYIAPEILDGKSTGHSFQVDIWSVGVIMYALLVGRPPYESRDVKSTYRRILANAYSFPEGVVVSDAAKSLIGRLLQTQPERRPSLEEIRRHPFLTATERMPANMPPPAPRLASSAKRITPSVVAEPCSAQCEGALLDAASLRGSAGLRKEPSAASGVRAPLAQRNANATASTATLTGPSCSSGAAQACTGGGGVLSVAGGNAGPRFRIYSDSSGEMAAPAAAEGARTTAAAAKLRLRASTARAAANKENSAPAAEAPAAAAVAGSRQRLVSTSTSRPALAGTKAPGASASVTPAAAERMVLRSRGSAAPSGSARPPQEASERPRSATGSAAARDAAAAPPSRAGSRASEGSGPASLASSPSVKASPPPQTPPTRYPPPPPSTASSAARGGCGTPASRASASAAAAAAKGERRPSSAATPASARKVAAAGAAVTPASAAGAGLGLYIQTPLGAKDTLEHMHEQLSRRLTATRGAAQTSSSARKARLAAAASPPPSKEIELLCHPKLWVARYVEYTAKYGVGVLLNDGSVCVYFNDATKIALEAAGSAFEYIERLGDGTTAYVVRRHSVQCFPPTLHKKVTLLQHFRNYLLSQDEFCDKQVIGRSSSAQAAKAILTPAGSNAPTAAAAAAAAAAAEAAAAAGEGAAEPKRLCYVKKWVCTRHAILFRLSDRTVQVIFFDGTQLLLTREARVVTYLGRDGAPTGGAEKCGEAMLLDSVFESGRTNVTKRLRYARDMMAGLIKDRGNSAKKPGKAASPIP